MALAPSRIINANNPITDEEKVIALSLPEELQQNNSDANFVHYRNELTTDFDALNIAFHKLFNKRCQINERCQATHSNNKQIEINARLKLLLLSMQNIAEHLAHIYSQLLTADREGKKWKKRAETLDNMRSNVSSLTEKPSIPYLRQLWDAVRNTVTDPKKTLMEFATLSLADLRAFFTTSNFKRLFLTRGRRTEMATADMFPSVTFLQTIKQALNLPVIDTTVKLLGWIYFLPRLSISLIKIIKHTFGIKITDAERNLPWTTRLSTQWSKEVWSDALNDAIWATVGLITWVWFLLNPLTFAKFGMNLVSSLYLFDVFIVGWKIYTEYAKHKTLLTNIDKKLERVQQQLQSQVTEKLSLQTQEKHLKTCKKGLREQIRHERKKVWSAFAITILLLFGMAFSISTFAYLGPIMPLMSAGLVLAISIGQYCYNWHLDSHAPKKGLDFIILPQTEQNTTPIPASTLVNTATPTDSVTNTDADIAVDSRENTKIDRSADDDNQQSPDNDDKKNEPETTAKATVAQEKNAHLIIALSSRASDASMTENESLCASPYPPYNNEESPFGSSIQGQGQSNGNLISNDSITVTLSKNGEPGATTFSLSSTTSLAALSEGTDVDRMSTYDDKREEGAVSCVSVPANMDKLPKSNVIHIDTRGTTTQTMPSLRALHPFFLPSSSAASPRSRPPSPARKQ